MVAGPAFVVGAAGGGPWQEEHEGGWAALSRGGVGSSISRGRAEPGWLSLSIKARRERAGASVHLCQPQQPDPAQPESPGGL